MISRGLCFLVVVACVFLIAVSANAGPAVISFYGEADGGSVTAFGYTPGHAPASLTGSDIRLPYLYGLNTPFLNSEVDETAVYSLASGTNGAYALLSFDTARNELTVTGRVPWFSNPPIGTDVVLLRGSFTSWTFSEPTDSSGDYSFTASGWDMKNAALLQNFGLPADTNFIFSSFSILMNSGSENTFIPHSTVITNTAVPIPPSLLLLTPGLVGLVVVRRRLHR